jgi:isopenicillin N synthase-like dioxygenase
LAKIQNMLNTRNVVVKELPRFNAVGKEAYQMLEKTGVYVLRALALRLGLDEFYFDNYAKDGNSILRPIHYPPITSEPANAIRAAAHGDINLITLLMGAQGKVTSSKPQRRMDRCHCTTG